MAEVRNEHLANAMQRISDLEELARRYKDETDRANRRYDQLVADASQLLAGLELARDALVSAINNSRKV